MPKATIVFNLPEEQGEYKTHIKAGDMASLISDFTQFLRGKVKYGTDKGSWEEAYEEWWNHLKDSDIDPYN